MQYVVNKNKESKFMNLMLVVQLYTIFTLNGNRYISYYLILEFLVMSLYLGLTKKLNLTICFDKFQKNVVLFAMFCILSSLWGICSAQSISKGITILQILVFLIPVYSYLKQLGSIQPLINALIYNSLIGVFFTFKFYGLDVIVQTLMHGSRLPNTFSNVNTIGQLAMYGVILLLFQVRFEKFSKLWLLACVPSVVALTATGSRKALFGLIIGVVYIVSINDDNNFSVNKILKMIIRIMLICVCVYFVLSLPIFNGINERMISLFNMLTEKGTYDHSAWLRKQFKIIGLEYFYRKPILGNGIACSGVILGSTMSWSTYFHDNYVELLAGGGIVGLIVYYNIYAYLILNILKNKKKSNLTKLILMLIGLVLILDYGQVTYYSKDTYIYLMMFYLHIQNINNDVRNVESDKFSC